jgi:hypothetical protein
MKLRTLAGLAAALSLSAPAAAVAAPVTVDLRIEGPTRTLYEGPVTTDVRPLAFSGDPAQHQCDGRASGGASPVPVPTRGAALMAAAATTPFAVEGSWHPDFGPSFTRIAGESVAYDAITDRYLVEFKNGRPADFGACGDPIQVGDDVVFAFASFGQPLLALSGPARVAPGGRATVRVTDAGTGAPIAGATVGGATTGADGTAAVGPFAGRATLKAEKPGAGRSNRLAICVTTGSDGACGTSAPAPGAPAPQPAAPDTSAPLGRVLGIREGRRFRRGRGPRELRGTVTADPSGIRAVKLRLTRQVGRRCWYFSGSKERFLRRACGTRYAFKVGEERRWSYLLPSRLKRGRYVLDVIAMDRRRNRDVLERGRSRVVFRVR